MMTHPASGKWNVIVKTPMGDKAVTLELAVDGFTLSGSFSRADHFVAISDGKIDGNCLTWSAKITQPMRLSLKFVATVAVNSIEGTAKHLLGSAPFHGKRA